MLQEDGNIKRLNYIIISLLLVLLVGCKNTPLIQNSMLQSIQVTSGAIENSTSEMTLHYIDVGQADCTLIESDGHYMLIDAGGNDKGTFVQQYLQKQGVKTLDYLILTHPDSDHIGGADVVITKFDIETIIMTDIENDTRSYDDVIQAMEYKRYKNTLPVAGETYQLGAAEFTIISPIHYEYDDNINDYSVGVIIQHGENRFLFVGDAEENAKDDILENGIDVSASVYKVAHHGSLSAAYEPFLTKVNPQYAVISCGDGNSYGHPHKDTLEWLRENDVSVYRTDEQGTIVCTSDGNNLSWNVPDSKSWKPGVPLQNQDMISENEHTADTSELQYVLNIKSRKIHYFDCSGVGNMSEKNKRFSDKTRDELIKGGYSPCGICQP